MKYIKYTLLCVFCVSSMNTLAETVYVSDRLKINMRTGVSNAHRIHARIRSGTRLSVLSVDKKSGYTEVKTASGKTGWVLSRQLAKQPSARNRLIKTQATLETLRTELAEHTQQLSTLQAEHDVATQSLQATLSENKILTEELTDIRQKASSALFIEKERNELHLQTVALETRLKSIEQQNQILQDSDRNVLFTLGASAVAFGLFMGLFLPRLWAQKRSSGWGNDYLS